MVSTLIQETGNIAVANTFGYGCHSLAEKVSCFLTRINPETQRWNNPVFCLAVLTLGHNGYGQCGRPIVEGEVYKGSQVINKLNFTHKVLQVSGVLMFLFLIGLVCRLFLQSTLRLLLSRGLNMGLFWKIELMKLIKFQSVTRKLKDRHVP